MMVVRARDRADMYKNSDPKSRKELFSRCPSGVFFCIICFVLTIIIYRFWIYKIPPKPLLPLLNNNLSQLLNEVKVSYPDAKNLNIVYRATTEKWDSQKFLDRTKNFDRTVIVIISDNDKYIGAYTSKKWEKD